MPENDKIVSMYERVTDLLKSLNIPYRVVEHEAVFHVGDTAEGLEDKVPVKSLLLTDQKCTRLFLFIVAGNERLDTKAIAKTLGVKKLFFAKPELLMEALGVTPGSVSVFSLLHDSISSVEPYVDEQLLQKNQELGFHPNKNTITIFFANDRLREVIESTGHDFNTLKMY